MDNKDISSEVSAKYTFSNNTFKQVAKDNPKDKIELSKCSVLPSFKGMISSVLCPGHYLEIVWGVVSLVLIYMVWNFIGFNIPTKIFLGYEYGIENIARFISSVMGRSIFPKIAAGATISPFVMSTSLTFFKLCFWGKSIAFKGFPVTLLGTKLFIFPRPIRDIKLLFADSTSFYYHPSIIQHIGDGKQICL
jgi:hypothetical protein